MANVSENKPNKSKAIREYVEANPEAKPKEIVEALAAAGVETTAAFVSTIKSKMKSDGAPTPAKGKPGRKPATATSQSSNGATQEAGAVTIEQLVECRKFVSACGSPEQAKAVLQGYSRVAG